MTKIEDLVHKTRNEANKVRPKVWIRIVKIILPEKNFKKKCSKNITIIPPIFDKDVS